VSVAPGPLPSGWPHSGQNIDPSGVDAPHELQRREISGCIKLFLIANCRLPIADFDAREL